MPNVKQPAEPPLVSCYQPGGGRVNVRVEVNDEVDWKEPGVRGSWRCRIVGWTAKRLRLELLSHDGRSLVAGELKHRTVNPHVSRVFRGGEWYATPAPIPASPMPEQKVAADLYPEKVPCPGMTVTPDYYQTEEWTFFFGGFWAALCNYLIGEPEARAAFKADTGLSVESMIPKNALEAMIDKATGYRADITAKWCDWVTLNHWNGKEHEAVPASVS